MKAWKPQDRERAYTSLCETITAVGEGREALFLARLCLLLAEELANAEAFAKALADATVSSSEKAPRDSQT